MKPSDGVEQGLGIDNHKFFESLLALLAAERSTSAQSLISLRQIYLKRLHIASPIIVPAVFNHSLERARKSNQRPKKLVMQFIKKLSEKDSTNKKVILTEPPSNRSTAMQADPPAIKPNISMTRKNPPTDAAASSGSLPRALSGERPESQKARQQIGATAAAQGPASGKTPPWTSSLPREPEGRPGKSSPAKQNLNKVSAKPTSVGQKANQKQSRSKSQPALSHKLKVQETPVSSLEAPQMQRSSAQKNLGTKSQPASAAKLRPVQQTLVTPPLTPTAAPAPDKTSQNRAPELQNVFRSERSALQLGPSSLGSPLQNRRKTPRSSQSTTDSAPPRTLSAKSSTSKSASDSSGERPLPEFPSKEDSPHLSRSVSNESLSQELKSPEFQA
ncbi:hypothetical protein COOONC_19223 [Cooperia oncophora]